MQTFGKREYGHMDLDPWARKTPREAVQRERSVSSSKIAGYVFALVAVGIIAVASFEILVLA